MSSYAVTAQFYDAIAGDRHAAVGRAIADALIGLDTDGHPIIDIGAGTGLTTQIIAQALPHTDILAVEPDPAMRTALMTRIWSNPDLRRRVSILPLPLASAPLPTLISAAIASASLVHFNPGQRQDLWALLAQRLLPTGRAVFEIQCPIAQDVPETCIASAQVGHITYESWACARRIDDDRQHWHLTYISRLHGREIDRQSTDYQCWVLSADGLLSEARAFGLAGTVIDNLVVLHKLPIAD